MMLGLGIVLLIAPQLLERVGTAIAVVGAAVLVTLAIIVVDRLVGRSPPAVKHG
jgi:hypothetical protein